MQTNVWPGLLLLCASSAALAASDDDPFLWLEEVSGTRAMAWVATENTRSLAVLEGDKRYSDLYQQALTIAEAKDRIPMPRLLGKLVLNFWQDTDHVRGLLRKTTLADYAKAEPAWETLLDLDALSTTEKANWVYKGATCEDVKHRLCMLSLSDGGEDASVLREFDVFTGKFVDGGFNVPRGKSRVAWEDPDTLLLVTEWGPGTLTTSGYPFIVKRVKRGTALADAKEVFRGDANDGGYGVSPVVLRDSKGNKAGIIRRPTSTFEFQWSILTPSGVQQLAVPGKSSVAELLAGRLVWKLEEDWTPSKGNTFAQGSLVSMELGEVVRHPAQPKPQLVIQPGPRQSIDQAAATKDRLLVSLYDNVRGRALVFTPDAKGWTSKPLTLPANASIGIVSASDEENLAFISVTSFLVPTTLHLVNATAETSRQVKALPARFNADQHTVAQFQALSTDGTQIPYFVVRPRDAPLDGTSPTQLYAYGGFQVSMTPAYAPHVGKLWLERGGTYVVANIRGGGEFGPAWHDAGLRTRRQIVYDDFAAVAQDLISRRVTSARRLAIRGGSNGGLLMGVEFEQHPELYTAVVIDVPLLDMLRIEKIAAGASWTGEYGSVSDPEIRAFWAKLSPYHNLKPGVRYPEPFLYTTTKDDRVGPAHARKFAARMGELKIPYLFYENTEGGHSPGANLRQTARAQALEMLYMIRKVMD
jgi:prolyl oligopeptidase